jgi:hypothetical protein
MPSPIIITPPLLADLADIGELVLGHHVGLELQPEASGNGGGRARVVPGQDHRGHPHGRQLAHRVFGIRARLVPHGDQAKRGLFAEHGDGGLAVLLKDRGLPQAEAIEPAMLHRVTGRGDP